jgi:hypothetical protein
VDEASLNQNGGPTVGRTLYLGGRPTVETRKEQSMTQDKVVVLQRGLALGCPAVLYGGSTCMEGEDQYRKRLPEMMPAHVAEVAAQLDRYEPEYRRRLAVEDREAQREADRAAAARPLDFDDPGDLDAQLARRMREDAAEAARRAEQPATRAQLDRLIGLLEEVRDGLQKRA